MKDKNICRQSDYEKEHMWQCKHAIDALHHHSPQTQNENDWNREQPLSNDSHNNNWKLSTLPLISNLFDKQEILLWKSAYFMHLCNQTNRIIIVIIIWANG